MSFNETASPLIPYSTVLAQNVLLTSNNADSAATNGGYTGNNKNTTTLRPPATTVGVGASFFDTTLNKPIWSDGANWKDAAGNTA